MADWTPPNPGDVQPGWLGVLLSGVLVLLVKPAGIALAKAIGRVFSRVGVQIDLGGSRQARAELEADIRERDALILALSTENATLEERVKGLTQDVEERDRRIAGLERENRALMRRGGGGSPPRGLPE